MLLDETLFWFSKDVSMELELAAREDNWSFLGKCNGALYLTVCNVTKGEEASEVLIVNPSGKNYVISGVDVNERDDWLWALEKVIDLNNEDLSHLAGQVIEKRGILSYNKKPKWFVLKEGVLMWFASENDPELEGSTTLANATVALGKTMQGEPAFVVATPREELGVPLKFVIGGKDRDECEEWTKYIRAAINSTKVRERVKEDEAEQNLMEVKSVNVPFFSDMLVKAKEGKFELQPSMFYVLSGSVFQWFDQRIDYAKIASIRKHIKGFISLRPGMSIMPGSEPFSFEIKSQNRCMQFKCDSERNQSKWLKELTNAIAFLIDQDVKLSALKMTDKEGFIMRGRVKVWTVVRDGQLLVFEKQNQKVPSVTIDLQGCGVCEAKDDKGILLFTSVSSLETFECIAKRGELKNERDQWFEVILFNIVKADKRKSSNELRPSPRSDSTQNMPAASRGRGNTDKQQRKRRETLTNIPMYIEQQRNGTAFCFVQKKRDLFFSIQGTEFLWYNSESERFLIGSTHLCCCTTKTDRKRVYLYGSDEKLIIGFEVKDESEAISWSVALQEAIFEADDEKGFKKIGTLSVKGKKKYVAVTTKHVMWFSSAPKMSDMIKVMRNPNAFDECVVLSETEVTNQGTKGIILSERTQNSDQVKVVVFGAETEEEQEEWMSVFLSIVQAYKPSTSSDGVPFYAFKAPLIDHCIKLQIEGNGILPPASYVVTELPNDEGVELFAFDAMTEESDLVSHVPFSMQGPHIFVQIPMHGSSLVDNFSFTVRGDKVLSENVAKVIIRRRMKKPLPLPPGVRAAEKTRSNTSFDGMSVGSGEQEMIEVVLYQKQKKHFKNEKWIEIGEDISSIQSEKQVLSKCDLRNMCLESDRFIETMLAVLPSTEQDTVIQSIVNLYACEGGALTMIYTVIEREIEIAETKETLFRTNSSATKLCKFYSDLVGEEFLHLLLGDPLHEIIEMDLEVDPNKLDKEKNVEDNIRNLESACALILDNLYASVEDVPFEIRFLCRTFWDLVGEKFGDMRFASVGGYIFLRFLCPAILTCDKHGICELDRDSRRSLTLVAKVLQNVSNGVEFGKKEVFMIPLNSFILKQLPLLKKYFEELCDIECEGFEERKVQIPRHVLERSTDNIYKQILFQKKKLEAQDRETFEQLIPILHNIGIPPKLKRALEKQGQAASAIVK